MPNIPLQPSLTFSGIEKVVNKFIAFVFYYRLVVVLIALGLLAYFGHSAWVQSKPEDQLKNLAVVFTCGSIVIAIFYSVLNYEYTHIRFKHDKKNTIDTLTFNIAAKGHDDTMIGHFRKLKIFYENNKHVLASNQNTFSTTLDDDSDTRISFMVVFNYFECIAVGMEKGLIDEEFSKEFFKFIIKDYYSMYNSYIEYLRQKNHTDRIFKSYTALAMKWKRSD